MARKVEAGERHSTVRGDEAAVHAVEDLRSRGGRPLGSGRQLPPQLTVGRRPLGGGGGGGALEGGV